MTRDTKTLLSVMIGAALVGWLVVRLVAPSSEAPEPRVTASANVTKTALDETEPGATLDETTPEAAPLAAAPEATPESTADADEDNPSEAILRDLEVLVRAVRQDKYMNDRAFPANTKVLEIPGVIKYLRAVEFWQPAFSRQRGD